MSYMTSSKPLMWLPSVTQLHLIKLTCLWTLPFPPLPLLPSMRAFEKWWAFENASRKVLWEL